MKKAGVALVAITVVFCIFTVGFLIGRNNNKSDILVRQIAADVQSSPNTIPASTKPAKVNINAATVDELTLLPGIGTKLAQRIVDYRNENGPFRAIEDLTNVSGIGDAKLMELWDYIVIGGSK